MQLYDVNVYRWGMGVFSVRELAGVAIGNPERHVRKASHRGSKQQ